MPSWLETTGNSGWQGGTALDAVSGDCSIKCILAAAHTWTWSAMVSGNVDTSQSSIAHSLSRLRITFTELVELEELERKVWQSLCSLSMIRLKAARKLSTHPTHTTT